MFNMDPYLMAAMIPAMIVGLTFHEYAHAKVADMLGDPTARLLGRVSLDPLKHLDIVGTLMFFLVGFGWAKPVPVNSANIKGNQRWGDILISLSGPATNIIVALVALLGLNWFGAYLGSIGNDILYVMFKLNVLLAALNLLPIPPLDGSALLMNLWRRPPGWVYFLHNNGTFVLLLLIFTNVIRYILDPVQGAIEFTLSTIAGLLS